MAMSRLVPLLEFNLGAPTSFNKGSDGQFASTYIFQFGWGPALLRTTILHLNVRPIEGAKWSTIQVQKSTIYLQSTIKRGTFHVQLRPY